MTEPTSPSTTTSDTPTETGGTGPGHRSVTLTRTSQGEFDVTNVRGGTFHIGTGESDDFTPVELLLTAIAGCGAVDIDFITSRRAEPKEFTVTSTGEKVKDAEKGNFMENLEVTFRVRFPEGPEGDKAREMVPRALAQSHDRLCSVSRTVQLGTPVTMREG